MPKQKMKLINSPGRLARGASSIALIGAACLAFVSTSFGQEQPKFSDVHGRLSVKGNKIVDERGI